MQGRYASVEAESLRGSAKVAQVSKAIQDKPIHVEGMGNSEWVLMDYGNVVVHVFQKHIREYYDIEGLWGDAVTTELTFKN